MKLAVAAFTMLFGVIIFAQDKQVDKPTEDPVKALQVKVDEQAKTIQAAQAQIAAMNQQLQQTKPAESPAEQVTKIFKAAVETWKPGCDAVRGKLTLSHDGQKLSVSCALR